MNVLMTTDSVTGVWTFCAELARSLDDHDVQVTLAVCGPALSQLQRSRIEGLSNVHVVDGHFRAEWMQEPWQDRQRASQWLVELAEKSEVDVVHLTGYVYACVDWPVPVLVSAQYDPIAWWRASRGEGQITMLERYRQQASACLASADLVVAPTHATLAEFQKEYGPLARWRVIGNALSPAAFEPRDKSPIVLGVGGLKDAALNTVSLVEAARRLPCPVYLAGDYEGPSVEGWTDGAVKTLGPLSTAALADWMSKAAIFASPALYDPLGFWVLQAALSGCALVLGDTASYRELWHDCALFVQAGDTEEIAMAIRYLLQDARLRKTLAHKALRRALTRRPSTMASQYLDAYREIRSLAQVRHDVLLEGRLRNK
jgi:glycosyltransferase involved in cell wall biosynthesis